MTYTPVAGYTSAKTLRFSRSGWLIQGKTHAVEADEVRGGQAVQTVCGKAIVASTVYSPDAWATLHAQPHATHETNVCRNCVRMAKP